jgi:hypothetical protein
MEKHTHQSQGLHAGALPPALPNPTQDKTDVGRIAEEEACCKQEEQEKSAHKVEAKAAQEAADAIGATHVQNLCKYAEQQGLPHSNHLVSLSSLSALCWMSRGPHTFYQKLQGSEHHQQGLHDLSIHHYIDILLSKHQ